MELRLRAAETLNLTFYEGTDRGSLHLHPPGEEEEEEEEEGRDERGPWTAFYCCLPLPPAAAESANPRRCLLRLANRTAATATVQEKPAWKVTQRGRCQDERGLVVPRAVSEGGNLPVFIWGRISFEPVFSLSPQRIHFVSLSSSSLDCNRRSVPLFPHDPRVTVRLNLHRHGCIDSGSFSFGVSNTAPSYD